MPKEVLLLLTAHGKVAGELGAVEQHTVEGRLGAERLELAACGYDRRSSRFASSSR